MRRQHHARTVTRCLKNIVLCGTLSASLLSGAAPLFASELSTETGAVSNASRPAEGAVGMIGSLFSDMKQYIGIRYRFGGTTPAGFDCSGFVQFMFSKVFNMQLPRSSREMSAIGIKVARNELKPGDLVFFQNGKNRINHVGIFIGNNLFIHSSLSRGITRTNLSESYYDKRFATGVRVVDFGDDATGQLFRSFSESGNPS